MTKHENYLKNRDAVILRAKKCYAENRSAKISYATEWRLKNWDRWYKRHREHIQRDPSKKRLAQQKYYEKNREKILIKSRAYASEYKRKNRARVTALQMEREVLKIMAMPKWVDRNAIVEIYKEARMMTLVTGIAHHVDHIFPLRGNGFVGLHVPWNLRVITAMENFKKGNRLQ